ARSINNLNEAIGAIVGQSRNQLTLPRAHAGRDLSPIAHTVILVPDIASISLRHSRRLSRQGLVLVCSRTDRIRGANHLRVGGVPIRLLTSVRVSDAGQSISDVVRIPDSLAISVSARDKTTRGVVTELI